MHPSPIAQASNPHTKPQARRPGSLLKGFANGGTIEGPGTPTSDSIPAQVAQTGEPIQVANGERIVSADQDVLLLRIAKAMGHKSVDEMFQAGTGKPVGPTMKYSKSAGKAVKAAESGAVIGSALEPYVNHRFYQPPPAVPGTAVGPANYQPNFTMGANQAAAPNPAVTDVRAKYNPANGSPEAKAWQASRQPVTAPAASAAPVPQPVPQAASGPSASSRMTQAFQQFTGVNGGGAGSKMLGTAGKLGAGALNIAGKAALPLAVGNEALQVGRVAMDPNSTGNDIAAQTAQGFGRLGAAGAGAAAGAALGSVVPVVGTAIGGLAGGVLGYMGADKAIEAGRSMLGVDPRPPSTRAPPILPTAAPTANAPQTTTTPPVSAPAAPAPVAAPSPIVDPQANNVEGAAQVRAAFGNKPMAGDPAYANMNSGNGQGGAADANNFGMAQKSATVRSAYNDSQKTLGTGVTAGLNQSGQLLLSNPGPSTQTWVGVDGKPTTTYANSAQYAQGVTDAANVKRIGDNMERARLQQEAGSSNPAYSKPAQARLAEMDKGTLLKNSTAMNDSTLAVNAANVEGTKATTKGNQIKNREADQQQALMEELRNPAITPERRDAIHKILLAGKQGKAPTFHPGSRIKNVDGSETVTPAYVFDPTTGEAREVGPGKSGVPDAATARTQALAALKANPANKDEINKRLAAAGYQPI